MGVENRLVLKMSGEALASTASDQTIDAATVDRLCREIAETREELDLDLLASNSDSRKASKRAEEAESIPAMPVPRRSARSSRSLE